MATELLILAALPWLLILLHQIMNRGAIVLLVWLAAAPLVLDLIRQTDGAVIFQSSGFQTDTHSSDFYYDNPAQITLQELLNPTRLLFGALFIAFLVNGRFKKRQAVALDKAERWMAIFSLLLLGNVYLRSGRMAFGLHVASDAFIIPFMSYYVGRRLMTNPNRWRQLTQVISYVGFYVIIYCIQERLTHSDLLYRLRGPFESGNSLYVVLTVAFFVALIGASQNLSLARQNTNLPFLVRRFVVYLTPVIIALTLVRGNWVGFIFGLGVFLKLGRRLVSFTRTVKIVGLTVFFVLFAALSFSLLVPEEIIEERITEQDNAIGRFATWLATIEMASEAPLFGVGLNNLQGLLSRERVTIGGFANYSTPHNSLLSILVELGSIALIAYSAAVLTILRMGLRLYRTGVNKEDRWRGVALIAIMVAYLTPSLFANTIYITGLIHIYVYTLAGALAGVYSGQLRSTPSQSYYQTIRGDSIALQRPAAG